MHIKDDHGYENRSPFYYVLIGLVVIGVGLLALLGAFAQRNSQPEQAYIPPKDKSQSVILQNGVLRCAYVPWPPGLYIDETTNQPTGIFYEVTNKAAKLLDLKVEWVARTEFGSEMGGLLNGSYDMVCSPNIKNYITDPNILYSDAVYSTRIMAWHQTLPEVVNTIDDLNQADLRVGVLAGADLTSRLAASYTPLAQQVVYPQGTAFEVMLKDIHQDKIDFVYGEGYLGKELEAKLNLNIESLSLVNKPIELELAMLTTAEHKNFMNAWNRALEEVKNTDYFNDVVEDFVLYPKTIAPVQDGELEID